jgi:hypothetical protein
MDWAQLLTIIGVNAGLFFWARSESRADFRYVMSVLDGIQKEMKEFHARLCMIEQDRKK